MDVAARRGIQLMPYSASPPIIPENTGSTSVPALGAAPDPGDLAPETNIPPTLSLFVSPCYPFTPGSHNRVVILEPIADQLFFASVLVLGTRLNAPVLRIWVRGLAMSFTGRSRLKIEQPPAWVPAPVTYPTFTCSSGNAVSKGVGGLIFLFGSVFFFFHLAKVLFVCFSRLLYSLGRQKPL